MIWYSRALSCPPNTLPLHSTYPPYTSCPPFLIPSLLNALPPVCPPFFTPYCNPALPLLLLFSSPPSPGSVIGTGHKWCRTRMRRSSMKGGGKGGQACLQLHPLPCSSTQRNHGGKKVQPSLGTTPLLNQSHHHHHHHHHPPPPPPA